MKMRVLVACEESGRVRDAFRKKGHDAISCDLSPTKQDGPHIVGDVLNILEDDWDLMVAHPPCTYICNAGVRWLNEADRWSLLYKAVGFFNTLLCANIPKIAIENPIPHGYAALKRKYDQIIHPWQFGHGETKTTCLWLKNLSSLIPTNIVEGREHRIHEMFFRLKDKSEVGKLRSLTYQGIADAMADQWGEE